jgi:pyridoxal phosphate enzyme (YggS family)
VKESSVFKLKAILSQIEQRIRQAAVAAGRPPESVRLVAVSKTKPIQMIRAAIAAGATDIGENYVQEAREKFAALGALPVAWHFIGHLQTNKAKYVVRIFDLIHSVDNLKLAQEVNRQAEKINKVQEILIQVNNSGEEGKSGIPAKDAPALIEAIAPLANIRVRGLMTLPPYFDDPERARPYFRALRLLRDEILEKDIPNISMTQLSMGMTGDFEAAIAEGATLVRIGTALFGRRD